MTTAAEYSRRSYEKHRQKVLARGRLRIASGATREAWRLKMASPENRARERDRNRERMRRKREPRRVARQAAKQQRLYAAEIVRVTRLERRQNRPSAADSLKARKRRFHAKHRQEINARSRAWRLAHPERVADALRQWRAAHPEQARDGVKRWIAAHSEQARALSRIANMKRRALHAKAFIEAVDPLVVYERARGICGICKRHVSEGQKWHVDHIEPLSKGGVHSYDNVQLAHAFCNVSKGAKILRGQGQLFQRVA